MIDSRVWQFGCIWLALSTPSAYADRSLQLSTAHLVVESSTVVVMHDHDIKQVKKPDASASGGIALEYNSTLRIVRKSDDAEIFKQAVMPLTTLTSVDNGRYFAGLSNLQTLSSQYNFLLISAGGQIVTTALISPTSGHCRSVSAKKTNLIRWFDEKAPTVQLSFAGDQVDAVTVVNPYDRAADGTAGKCVVRISRANSTEKP